MAYCADLMHYLNAMRHFFCSAPALSFSRTVAPETSKGPALIALMGNYRWSSLIIISVTDLVYFESARGLKRLLDEAGLQVVTPAAFESGKFNEAKATEIRRSGIRIVFVLAWEEDIVAIASANQGAGWAWVSAELAGRGAEAMQGWLALVQFIPSVPEEFAKQVSDYSKSHFNLTLNSDSVDLGYSAALHDAIMLYAHAVTKVMSDGGNLQDGEAVTAAVRNTTFTGVGGTLVSLNTPATGSIRTR